MGPGETSGEDLVMMKPFSDDGASVSLGEMTIENGPVEITIYGQLSITADKVGLATARRLLDQVSAIHAELEARKDLPDTVAAVDPNAVSTVKNPFQ